MFRYYIRATMTRAPGPPPAPLHMPGVEADLVNTSPIPIHYRQRFLHAPDASSVGIHDPSMLKVEFNILPVSTHGLLHAHTSTDRINFSDEATHFPLPSWTGTYTAEAAIFGRPMLQPQRVYWLYYAASTSERQLGNRPGHQSHRCARTYVDAGAPVYTSTDCTGSNAIIPPPSSTRLKTPG